VRALLVSLVSGVLEKEAQSRVWEDRDGALERVNPAGKYG
jgi:hypothetical protein